MAPGVCLQAELLSRLPDASAASYGRFRLGIPVVP